jgi:hypothetical protein
MNNCSIWKQREWCKKWSNFEEILLSQKEFDTEAKERYAISMLNYYDINLLAVNCDRTLKKEGVTHLYTDALDAVESGVSEIKSALKILGVVISCSDVYKKLEYEENLAEDLYLLLKLQGARLRLESHLRNEYTAHDLRFALDTTDTMISHRLKKKVSCMNGNLLIYYAAKSGDNRIKNEGEKLVKDSEFFI